MNDTLQIILTAFVSIAVGGGLVGLFTIRWQKKKEQGLASQELEKAEDLSISNADRLISMYKTALVDARALHAEQMEESKRLTDILKKQIAELITQVDSQSELMKRQQVKLDEQGEFIKQLKSTQDELVKEINELKSLGNAECNTCSFFNGCKKRLTLISK